MQNKPETNETKKQKDGWAAMLYMGTFAAAVAGANIMFLDNLHRAQDADPVFVMPVAEQAVEDMGYNNVRIATFNKVSEDKSARLTFSAEKDFSTFIGEADCTARGCSRVKVTRVAYSS